MRRLRHRSPLTCCVTSLSRRTPRHTNPCRTSETRSDTTEAAEEGRGSMEATEEGRGSTAEATEEVPTAPCSHEDGTWSCDPAYNCACTGMDFASGCAGGGCSEHGACEATGPTSARCICDSDFNGYKCQLSGSAPLVGNLGNAIDETGDTGQKAGGTIAALLCVGLLLAGVAAWQVYVDRACRRRLSACVLRACGCALTPLTHPLTHARHAHTHFRQTRRAVSQTDADVIDDDSSVPPSGDGDKTFAKRTTATAAAVPVGQQEGQANDGVTDAETDAMMAEVLGTTDAKLLSVPV